MDQEVNLSIKLGDLSLSSDISATFVINGPDQVVTGIKEFEDGIDIGENNNSLGHKCLAVGNNLVVGQYNFFYKGIEINQNDNFGLIYLCEEQPRFPLPMVRVSGTESSKQIKMNGKFYNCNSETSLTNILTASVVSGIAKCLLSVENDTAKRADYNQLCIWFDGPDYYNDASKLVLGFTSAYNIAFEPEADFEKYHIDSSLSGDDIITIVNNDKIQGLRCAKVKEVQHNGSVLSVEFIDRDKSALLAHGVMPQDAELDSQKKYLSSTGIKFNDFDYDDASLVFIDHPLLSGPANTTTYSSLNIGDRNKTMRRCSFAAGKENATESDFCTALGRRAHADGYCSFVWAPAKEVHSPRSHSFTVGQQGVLSSIIKPENAKQRTMYVGGISGDYMELHKFIYGCISSDSYLLQNLFENSKENLEKMTILDFGGGDISVLNFTNNTINQAKLSSLGLYHPNEGTNDLVWDKNLYSVRIGTDITALGVGCFRNSTTLKDVWMSDSIQSIGTAQFYKCGQLSSIRISRNLQKISSSVFSGCNSLKKLELPEGIIIINDSAFNGAQIDELIINRTTTEISASAFQGLGNSTVIFKDRTMDEVKQIPNYSQNNPWNLPSTSTISTYNNATQEWVKDNFIDYVLQAIDEMDQTQLDQLKAKLGIL